MSKASMEFLQALYLIQSPSVFPAPVLELQNLRSAPESLFKFSESMKPLKTDVVHSMLILICECNSCVQFNARQGIKQQIAKIERQTDRLRRFNARIKNPRRMRRLLRRLTKAGVISGPCIRWTQEKT